MSSKNKEALKSMKEYEKAQRETAAKLTNAEKSPVEIDFDQWWIEKSHLIKQPSYIKEILYADAKGRGLVGKQTSEKWDEAAKLFGLSI